MESSAATKSSLMTDCKLSAPVAFPILTNACSCPSSQKNSLIVPADLPSAFLRSATVLPNDPTVLFQEVGGPAALLLALTFFLQDEITRHDVTTSGLFVLIMAVCDPDAAPVAIGGAIDSMDPCKQRPSCHHFR